MSSNDAWQISFGAPRAGLTPECAPSRKRPSSIAGANLRAKRRNGTSRAGRSGRHRVLEVLIDLVEEAGGREPFLIGAHQQREVLGHQAQLDGVDRDLLERR